MEHEHDRLFRRAEIFHQMLMEDFRFMEAARMGSGEYEAATLSTEHLFRNKQCLLIDITKERYKKLLITNPYGLINFAKYSIKPEMDDKTKKVYDSDVRSLRFQTRMAKWPPLDIFAHYVLNTKFFQALMIALIILSSVLIIVDLELRTLMKWFGLSDEILLRKILEGIDFFFLCWFAAEIILKWIDDFKGFWREGGNIFDLACTLSSLIPPFVDIALIDDTDELDETQVLAIVRYFRVFRIFRNLNVVTRIHKIQVIWRAVMQTFSELFSITVLMAIFFYIFAIVGIHIFKPFSKSHKPKLLYRTAFDNLFNAVIHLFLVFTVDNYQDLLESLMGIAKVKWQAVIYILLWILIAGFIFQNIFTGVMVNNFQNIRVNLIEHSTQIQQNRRLAVEMALMDNESDEDEGNEADGHLSWEKDVLQNLEMLESVPDRLTPSIWPRDTLFLYYVLVESLATNADERNFLIKQLDQGLVRHMDP